MAVDQVVEYIARCDQHGCGIAYGDGSTVMRFDSLRAAQDTLNDAGWLAIWAGNNLLAYCPDHIGKVWS